MNKYSDKESCYECKHQANTPREYPCKECIHMVNRPSNFYPRITWPEWFKKCEEEKEKNEHLSDLG